MKIQSIDVYNKYGTFNHKINFTAKKFYPVDSVSFSFEKPVLIKPNTDITEALQIELSDNDIKETKKALLNFVQDVKNVDFEKHFLLKGYKGGLKLNNEGKVSSKLGKSFDNNLNRIIKCCPEFISTFSKPQHSTITIHDDGSCVTKPNQAYTVDIHTLYGLQIIAKSKEFKKLNKNDKLITVMGILFHDIAKPSGINDRKHPEKGALIVEKIAERLKFSYTDIQRITNIVKYHQWFEMVSKAELFLDDITEVFKDNPADVINILIPFADADLRAIGPDKFYNMYGKENFYMKLIPSLKEQSEMLKAFPQKQVESLQSILDSLKL